LNKTLRVALRATSVAALMSLGMAAHAEFNANIEFDNTWFNNGGGLSQSGRVELNALGKLSPNYFVAGKASFLAKKDGGTATDDLWVQFGSASADLKLGRFEAANLFPRQRDTLVPYAGFTPYLGETLRGRGFVSSGDGLVQPPNGGESSFHAAGTFNAGSGLSFELGVVGGRSGTTELNRGVRPVISYTAGPLFVSAGVELVKYANDERENGFAGTVGYTFGDYTINVNLATIKDSFGGKAKSAGLVLSSSGIGGGLIYGDHETLGGKEKVGTAYVTYSFPLFDIKGATITPALAYSKAGGASTAEDIKAARVRINYAF
jgi:Porin-like glycoporin RafY